MRLAQILPFAGFAVAQVAKVQGVFETISADVDALDTAIKAFSGDAGPLTSASQTLLADIKDGTTTIEGSDVVDITGATQIAQFVTGLQTKVETAMSDLVAAKEKIVAAGEGGTVYANLVEQKAASGALADATVAKTPEALRSVAQQLSGGVTAAIQTAIDAYKSEEGKTSGGSSGAGSSAGSASSGSSSGSSSSEDHSGMDMSGDVAPAVAPAASAAPTAAATASSHPECEVKPTLVTSAKPSYTATPPKASAPVSTTKPPTTQFTGAAYANGPAVGFAMAAVGVIAAM